MVKQHLEKGEAELNMLSAVDEALERDCLMTAVWSVDERGALHLRRTTWQFPTERFQEGFDMLQGDILTEIDPTPEPLPLANFLDQTVVAPPVMPDEVPNENP